MISLIDKYVAKLFVNYFVMSLVVFVTLYVSIDFITTMNSYDVAIEVLINFYTYSLPAIIHQMLPVAALVATVFTLNALNRNSELIALYSCGLSLARISVPILSVVVVISSISYWLGDRILPVFAQKKNYVYYVEMKKKPSLYSTVKTNKIWYRSKNVLFNIQMLMPEEKKAQGIALYYFDSNWRLIQLIKANEVLFSDRDWTLKKGTVTVFAEETSFPLTKSFEEKKIVMDEDAGDLSTTSDSAEVLSVSQLASFIRKNKEAGLDTTRYEMDLQAKFSYAFAAFVMSLLGIPFSITRVRSRGGLLNIGICIGITFFYWTLYNSFLTMGRLSYVAPIVGAWLPNLLTALVAFAFLLRVGR